MAEYIECRHCDSPQCDGCNLNTLAKMLHGGRFDCLMDNKHSIKRSADVVEVRHGKWVDNGDRDRNGVPKPFAIFCSVCESSAGTSWMKYCPNCGAKMDGKEDSNER